MSTGLFALGLVPGEPPEGWLLRHPERVAAIHQGFVEAGADILLTNTFGANTARLRVFSMDDRCASLNRAAARLARDVASRAGRPVLVAGTMGPLGLDAAVPPGAALFARQAEALAEGGVDLAWIETMGSVAEARAAATAATATGLGCVVTASFDTAGSSRAGMSPAEFADAMAALETPPLAIGANCGTGPADVLASLAALQARCPGARLVAKASAGLPTRVAGALAYPATPDAMAAYARDAVAMGAAIVGGCCGTTPGHLAAMRRALDTSAPPSDAPARCVTFGQLDIP